MCILFVYTLLKVVSYYDLSVLSISVMGFQKKFGWGGWVCGSDVSYIQVYFGFLEFFNFAVSKDKYLTAQAMYIVSASPKPTQYDNRACNQLRNELFSSFLFSKCTTIRAEERWRMPSESYSIEKLHPVSNTIS